MGRFNHVWYSIGVLTLVNLSVVSIAADPAPKQIHIQAHRGNSAHVMENLIASFLSAIRAEANSFELDVSETKDGELVIFHDQVFSPHNTLLDGKAIGAPIAILDLTLAQIKRFEINELKHLTAPNTLSKEERRVPTLRELFDAIKREEHPNARKIMIDVEIKSEPDHPNWSPEPKPFAERIYREIKNYGPPGQVIVRSFDHRVLYELKKLDPNLRMAALVWPNFPRETDEDLVHKLKIDVFAPRLDMITPETAAFYRAHNIPIAPYTVNSQAELNHVLSLGVDGVTGDDPAQLRRWIEEYGYVQAVDSSALYNCRASFSKL